MAESSRLVLAVDQRIGRLLRRLRMYQFADDPKTVLTLSYGRANQEIISP